MNDEYVEGVQVVKPNSSNTNGVKLVTSQISIRTTDQTQITGKYDPDPDPIDPENPEDTDPVSPNPEIDPDPDEINDPLHPENRTVVFIKQSNASLLLSLSSGYE